jgi:hypothetical protein
MPSTQLAKVSHSGEAVRTLSNSAAASSRLRSMRLSQRLVAQPNNSKHRTLGRQNYTFDASHLWGQATPLAHDGADLG